MFLNTTIIAALLAAVGFGTGAVADVPQALQSFAEEQGIELEAAKIGKKVDGEFRQRTQNITEQEKEQAKARHEAERAEHEALMQEYGIELPERPENWQDMSFEEKRQWRESNREDMRAQMQTLTDEQREELRKARPTRQNRRRNGEKREFGQRLFK